MPQARSVQKEATVFGKDLSSVQATRTTTKSSSTNKDLVNASRSTLTNNHLLVNDRGTNSEDSDSKQEISSSTYLDNPSMADSKKSGAINVDRGIQRQVQQHVELPGLNLNALAALGRFPLNTQQQALSPQSHPQQHQIPPQLLLAHSNGNPITNPLLNLGLEQFVRGQVQQLMARRAKATPVQSTQQSNHELTSRKRPREKLSAGKPADPTQSSSTANVVSTVEPFAAVAQNIEGPLQSLVPCRSRGMPSDHNSKTAYFVIPHNAKHGDNLICSYEACRNEGVKFWYCSHCGLPVAKRNFRQRHSHASEPKVGDTTAEAAKNEKSSSEVKKMLPNLKQKKPGQSSKVSLSSYDFQSSFLRETNSDGQPPELSSGSTNNSTETDGKSCKTKPYVSWKHMDVVSSESDQSEQSLEKLLQRKQHWASLLSQRPADNSGDDMSAWLMKVLEVSNRPPSRGGVKRQRCEKQETTKKNENCQEDKARGCPNGSGSSESFEPTDRLEEAHTTSRPTESILSSERSGAVDSSVTNGTESTGSSERSGAVDSSVTNGTESTGSSERSGAVDSGFSAGSTESTISSEGSCGVNSSTTADRSSNYWSTDSSGDFGSDSQSDQG